MRNVLRQLWVTGVLAAATAGPAGAASIYDDNFADGVRGPQWSSVIDDAGHLNLAEQNGRLDLLNAPGGTVNDDALYLSTFALSTAANFEIRIDYSFTQYATAGATGTAVGLVFGVGKEAEGYNSAAIGQGFGTTTVSLGGGLTVPVTAAAGTVGYRTNDVSAGPDPTPLTATTGTFDISYNTATDVLTLQRVGGGLNYSLADTVRQKWAASSLLVSFGGRGNGFNTTAGQANLDNFTIVSGTVVPEPGALSAVAVLGLLGLRRRVVRSELALS